MRSPHSAVVALLLLAGASDAAAHHTFIMPQSFRVSKGDPVVVGFHSADTFPESTELIKRLDHPALVGPDGPDPIRNVHPQGKRLVGTILVPGAGHFVVTGVVPTATATMKAAGFNKYLQEEGLTEVIAARAQRGETDKPAKERFSAYAKTILLSGEPSDFYRTAVGFHSRSFLKRTHIDWRPEKPCPCA
jgi:hypothetical protein